MTAKIVNCELNGNGEEIREVENNTRLESSAQELPRTPLNLWQHKFMQRHLKQLRWDSEKRDQRLLKQSRLARQQEQLVVQDKERGQNAAKARRGQERQQSSAWEGNAQRSLRAVRVKTCRRCSEKFMPGLNEADSCRWHRGQYIRIDNDSDSYAAGNQTAMNVAANKKVQQLLKANGNKKGSKRHNVGIHTMAGGRWAWSCCGAENMVEPGCASGPHS